MRTTSIRVYALVLSCFAAPPCIAGTYTPLDWQAAEAVEIGPAPEGPFEVAVGFDRCFELDELEPALSPGGSHFVIKSDLVSAAVFRFASREEFAQQFAPHRDGTGLRATVFQFGPMRLGHGTSVRRHETRESPQYSGLHPYERGIRGASVGIAIVDSGVAADHIQLDDTGYPAKRWVAGWDALTGTGIDPVPRVPHGSAVAGIALGKGLPYPLYQCRNYECGGMAPEAGLIDVKITNSTEVQISDAIEGLEWLAKRHDSFNTPNVVANLSFFTCSDDSKGTSPPAAQADALVGLGIPVVAAHGNASSCGLPSRCDALCTKQTGSPGSSRYVITVAGTDDMGKVDRRHHRPFCDGLCGPRREEKPDLSASAELVAAPSPIDGVFDLYARRSGTSIAAAHVSGAVALVKSARPHMPPADIKQQLIDSADRQHNPDEKDWDPELGWGILKLDWLTALAATPPDRLADLTFKGCLEEVTDGPLADCRLESAPPWGNHDAIQVGESDNGMRTITVNVMNYGPMAVSALVRLEGYDRVIGNRQYHHLEDRTVDLLGGGEAEISFSVTDPAHRLQHFRASIHSAWDRSYRNNRTQFNIPARGSSVSFLLDSPFLEPAHLELETRRPGCRVTNSSGLERQSEDLTPDDCPQSWTLTSEDGKPCDLTVSGGPPDRAVALGGIRLDPTPSR